ncbi:GNAT family N-acetyltransferase [Streptomyces sp. NPDC052496]|uniref:GNAT family N-acetyltransferase n=1 Tax=Streptomyces sp. NPDC052496 TaxID=3154951 RepID=UPI00342461EE
MILVRAELADLPRLLQYRTDAAAWLKELGTDQWARPFPAENILASIRRGEVFLVKEDADHTDSFATITLDRQADERLWNDEERQESSLYVHKLTVDRRAAGRGLGVRLLDWAGDQAARRGCRWLRLDAWSTNTRLQSYYQGLGFEHVRTSTDPTVVSGWAAQRPARRSVAHGLSLFDPYESWEQRHVNVLGESAWDRILRSTWRLASWCHDYSAPRSRAAISAERHETWLPAAVLLALALWRAGREADVLADEIPLDAALPWLVGEQHQALYAAPLPVDTPVPVSSWSAVEHDDNHLATAAQRVIATHLVTPGVQLGDCLRALDKYSAS